MAHSNQEVLDHLVRELNLPGLAFDKDGSCEITIGEHSVYLLGEPTGSFLRLSGSIGTLPDSESPAALQMLLQANFIGQGTGQASLGMDPISQEIVLGHALDVNSLDAHGLLPVLEEFVNFLAYWEENLDRLASEASEDQPRAAADAAASAMGGMRV